MCYFPSPLLKGFFAMQRHVFLGCFALLAATGLVVACGDDDNTVTPPPNTNDGGSSGTSGTSGTSGGTSGTSGATSSSGDGGTSSSGDGGGSSSGGTPLVPQTVVKLQNAINPYGILVGNDGATLAAGATIDAGVRKLAVWRLKDGAVDATFNGGNPLTTDIPGDESAWEMVEVSANNYVILATSSGKVYLVSLTNNAGTYTFGTPKFIKFGYDDGEPWPAGTPNMPATAPSYSAWGIAVDRSVAATPKIVVFAGGAPAKNATVAMQRIDNDRWITRVNNNADFTFDTTFNGGAPYSVDADGKAQNDNARRGFVHTDGSIYSAGYTNFGTGQREGIVIIKLLPTGAPDPAFGFGTSPAIPGQIRVNPYVAAGGNAEAYNVGRQSDGKLVTGGYGFSNHDVTSKAIDAVTTRIAANGSALDTTWGKSGAYGYQSEGDKTAGLGASAYTDRSRDMIVLPDDRIVHGGAYDDFSAIIVTDKNGKPEPNGIIEYAFPNAFFKITKSADSKFISAASNSQTVAIDGGTRSDAIIATLKVGP